jgi:plastocyanin domain-containing protein
MKNNEEIQKKSYWKIASVVMVILLVGIITYNMSSSSAQSKLTGNSISGPTNAALQNGVQEINMNIESNGYSPNSFVLKTGVPVKWNIDVKQLTGCNSQLILRDYGITKNLQQGLNTIEFTPDKEGTFTFNCGMGMLRGSLIVTASGTATQDQIQKAAQITSNAPSSGGCGCGGAR